MNKQNLVLHIGTNLGDRVTHLLECMMLIEEFVGPILRKSNIWNTAAWGNINQGDFLNQAFEISTTLSPLEVLKTCQFIEKSMGRSKCTKWGPRIIDVDIIFYSDQIIFSDELVIPHPHMHERNFVLSPLAEIIPEWQHPISLKTVSELKRLCTDLQVVNEMQHV